jgi:hypothetical protein
MSHREWTHHEGPFRFRICLYQDPEDSGGNICLEIRDWRQPNQYRYRGLSLGHQNRERAIRYAKVLVRWWMRTGIPPQLVWRRGRGPLPKEVAA